MPIVVLTFVSSPASMLSTPRFGGTNPRYASAHSKRSHSGLVNESGGVLLTFYTMQVRHGESVDNLVRGTPPM